METPYYNSEKKKEDLKRLKAHLSAYSYIVECLKRLKDALLFADTKRLMKKEIDKCNSLLPEGVYITLNLQKEWWLGNTIKIHIEDAKLKDSNGDFILGNRFNIYPIHGGQYLAKDRTFDYSSFVLSIDHLIDSEEKNVEQHERAIEEFTKWTRKINKLVELCKEIKDNAPEFFRYNIPDLRHI